MTTSKEQARLRRHARIRAKIKGTALRPRLVVFRSLRYITAQLIDDENNITLASASDIKEKKGTRSERAAKVGVEIAKIAKEKKITEIVFDRNGYKYHGRVKTLADSAREEGLKF